ncbi:LysR family transcriptional regulator [Pseudoduganella violacea]|uniref:DNA-binding transcriptional LysR family regulator n=1 Tax=Pseudoduganella violacea TaxID=1715466 RepID=A0A7W5FS18_9BURK|nr:LysR family transcriptional regulator [Pseudoduganella violacea]MBB3117319.1 DNA-binding transcriptional LysR family regulator [Pseudoduganella violacea]
MTFTQLEIFALVAELQGFTAAAMRLGISQSAVSHAIKSLEQELGAPLILRQQATAEVTEVGQRLLTRAREILGLAEAMRQEVAAARGLNQGLLRIGSFGPTASLKLMPAILAVFHKRYPGIEVQIDEGGDHDVLQWLLDRRVDVGFVVLPDERFDTVPLVEDQLVALLPAEHALAERRAISVNDLADVPYILGEAGCASLMQPVFAAHGISPKVRYRISQIMTILGMVGSGDGVTVMPELALPKDMERAYPQVALRPFRPAVRRRVGLALRDLRQASPAAKAFIDTAREVVKTLA